MSQSALITQLIEAFQCLPGVGPKSAQRMAYHLLERNRDGGRKLSATLLQAIDHVGRCKHCRTFTEDEVCNICSNPRRDSSLLCIVESPADAIAIEKSTGYKGLYFILMGHLSPLDGIGPDDIGLDVLANRLAEGEVKEIVIATNSTVEGEATAHFIGEMTATTDIATTRIAHGVPLGGELEYVDGQTLFHAFAGRRSMT